MTPPQGPRGEHAAPGEPLPARPPATLSANLYCSRRVHDLLRDVVAPWARETQSLLGDAHGALWFFRHARCGRHLKLRLHAAEDTSFPALRGRLQELAETFFAACPEPPAASSAGLGPSRRPPAIDEEDEREHDYPDPSLLWTQFRPSSPMVGSASYLPDLRFLNLFYQCMDAHTARVLAAACAAPAEPDLRARQSQLLHTVIGSLFSLDLPAAELLSYLRFHRDWLLRFLLLQADADSTADDALARLDRKIERMDGTVAALLAAIAARLAPHDDPTAAPDGLAAVRTGLRAFFAHVRGFRGRPELDVDPYTADFAFPPLFKVLHSFANQVGVPPLNEFYTYQLLFRAAERLHAAAPTERPA